MTFNEDNDQLLAIKKNLFSFLTDKKNKSNIPAELQPQAVKLRKDANKAALQGAATGALGGLAGTGLSALGINGQRAKNAASLASSAGTIGKVAPSGMPTGAAAAQAAAAQKAIPTAQAEKWGANPLYKDLKAKGYSDSEIQKIMGKDDIVNTNEWHDAEMNRVMKANPGMSVSDAEKQVSSDYNKMSQVRGDKTVNFSSGGEKYSAAAKNYAATHKDNPYAGQMAKQVVNNTATPNATTSTVSQVAPTANVATPTSATTPAATATAPIATTTSASTPVQMQPVSAADAQISPTEVLKTGEVANAPLIKPTGNAAFDNANGIYTKGQLDQKVARGEITQADALGKGINQSMLANDVFAPQSVKTANANQIYNGNVADSLATMDNKTKHNIEKGLTDNYTSPQSQQSYVDMFNNATGAHATSYDDAKEKYQQGQTIAAQRQAVAKANQNVEKAKAAAAKGEGNWWGTDNNQRLDKAYNNQNAAVAALGGR
jgi:hypothetical protein